MQHHKFLVWAKHPMQKEYPERVPDLVAEEFTVGEETHGYEEKPGRRFHAWHGQLGSGKAYPTAEYAIRYMLRDHGYRLENLEKVR